MLKEKVGEKAFKTAVKNYLEEHQFKNVETIDFINEVEVASEQDLSGFVKVWLEDIAFPFERALDALKQNSPFIQEYLMVDSEIANSKSNYYLKSGVSDEAKIKIISQIPEAITSQVFKSNLKVRQAIAQHLTKIPLGLKSDYESLLNDDSYITNEVALLNLWVNFPKYRARYLEKTKNIVGFNNKNVRLLWLTLTLLTDDFKKKEDKQFLEELNNYTSSKYNFEIRISAFNYLYNLDVFNKNTLINLTQATKHHNWQFKKFAKNLILKLEQIPDYKDILEKL
jgi:aminopeptidase N